MCLSETCSENPVCYKRLHTHILRLIMFCRHNLLLKALLRRYEKDQVMQGNCIRFSHLSSPCSWISWFICIFPNFIRLTCTQTCPGLHVRVRAQNILNQLRKQNARTNDPITRMDDTRLQAQLELYLHDWNGLQFRLFMVPSGADIGSVCGLWRLWPQLCSLPASIEPASSQRGFNWDGKAQIPLSSGASGAASMRRTASSRLARNDKDQTWPNSDQAQQILRPSWPFWLFTVAYVLLSAGVLHTHKHVIRVLWTPASRE